MELSEPLDHVEAKSTSSSHDDSNAGAVAARPMGTSSFHRPWLPIAISSEELSYSEESTSTSSSIACCSKSLVVLPLVGNDSRHLNVIM